MRSARKVGGWPWRAGFSVSRLTHCAVAWIEYRDVPRPVMERFDESLERLMALDHENLVKGTFLFLFACGLLT
jgi:hypothetical protein